MAITPSVTTIKPLTRIRQQRLLPQAGEVVVRRGQQVTPVQVVARASQQRGYTIIPAAELLGVAPEEVSDYLLVEEGAAVQRQKPLLRKPGLFRQRRLTSPVNGVLYQVHSGRLILQQTPDLVEVRAMMHGHVVDFIANRGVLIEAKGTLIQGSWSTDREGFGAIRLVAGGPDEPLRSEHIDVDARGAILVTGRIDRGDVLEEAEENSVRGVVAGSAPATLIRALHHVRFPIVLTEGFGREGMAGPIFDLLGQSEGRDASLFAARSARPEIVIPLPAPQQEEATARPEPVTVGRRVRVLRAPHAGTVAEVVAVHTHSQSTAIGLRAAGAEVALSDGKVVFVPFANLDLIR